MAPKVCFETKAGHTYLYNPEVQTYVLLDNQVSIDIVSLCDGRRTMIDIANAIDSRYQAANPPAVLIDVRKMLTLLHEEEFVLLEDPAE